MADERGEPLSADRGAGGGGAFFLPNVAGLEGEAGNGGEGEAAAATAGGTGAAGVAGAGLDESNPLSPASLACRAFSRSSASCSAFFAFSSASFFSLASLSSMVLSCDGVEVALGGAMSPNLCCLSSRRRAASARIKACLSSGVIFLVAMIDGEGAGGGGDLAVSTFGAAGGAGGGVRALGGLRGRSSRS